jgi:uncharacterized membrane protein
MVDDERTTLVNTVLWILQGVLAAAFLMAGVLKLTQPKDKLAPKLPWVEDFSTGTVRLIGLAELLGALGLILPAATGIAPLLTPLAAAALAVVMVLASIVHARRKEPSGIAFNAVLFVLAAIIAWGRFGPYAL